MLLELKSNKKNKRLVISLKTMKSRLTTAKMNLKRLEMNSISVS
jgi:hypothetical protein